MNEQKTIPQILDEIASEICDKYCKYPYEISDEEELMKKYRTYAKRRHVATKNARFII